MLRHPARHGTEEGAGENHRVGGYRARSAATDTIRGAAVDGHWERELALDPLRSGAEEGGAWASDSSRVYVGGRSPSESLVGRRNVLFRLGSNASLSAAAESGNRTLSRLELLNH
jgi:hypothetical protein